MFSKNIFVGAGVLVFGSVLPLIVRAGVISSAPDFSSVLLKILYFLLSIVGIVAILSVAIAGGMYLFSNGDATRIAVAKKYTWMVVIGLAIALGALILVRQIGRLLM